MFWWYFILLITKHLYLYLRVVTYIYASNVMIPVTDTTDAHHVVCPGRWPGTEQDPFQVLRPGQDTLITLSLGFLPLENEGRSTALIKLLSRLNKIPLGWIMEKCWHSTVSELQKCQFSVVHPTTCEVPGSPMHSKDLFHSSGRREELLISWILGNNSMVSPPPAHPSVHGHQ